MASNKNPYKRAELAKRVPPAAPKHEEPPVAPVVEEKPRESKFDKFRAAAGK